jgi:hypothetical protein
MNLANAFARSRSETPGETVPASEAQQYLGDHSLAPNSRNPVKRSSNCSATEHPPERRIRGTLLKIDHSLPREFQWEPVMTLPPAE